MTNKYNMEEAFPEVCPQCNGKVLDCVHPLPLSDNMLRLSFACTGCGYKWSDIYKVHRITEQVIHPRKETNVS